ncbi:hypothetical protein GH714_032633 [Hevea brasiliensis]|uniref:Glycosyl hydrolase family 95 N-terminal domain-containing protein n=1 Tax=Hevea brasiliensis TaxID=3981 RepID=A0A6A6N5R8_HEVBR|nr:hypothetical protein GH714_032633 [Hevea brasiliensis]
MEEDGEWVVVRRPPEKDWWKPSLMDDKDDDDDGETSSLKITFGGPAKYWTDAIPIGNGRIGAMIWGGVASETLQLNDDTLWTGTPGNYTNPNAPEALSEVRKLVDDGKYAEATTAAVKLSGNPSDVYQLIGDIKLEFDDSHLKYDEKTYHRELDLDTATARVKYSVGDVEYTREHFASNPDQVIVTKISGSKSGSVSFTVSLDSKMHPHSYVKGENQIVIDGSCPGKRIPPKLNANENPEGIHFTAILNLQISEGKGMIHVLDGKKLKVEGSDWVVLLLAASSSFDGPFTKPNDSKKDPTSESLSALNLIRNLSYNDLYVRHLDDYQNLFHRVSLKLSKSSKSNLGNGPLDMKKLMAFKFNSFFKGSEDETISTAERVKSFQTNEDPSLVELLFQYGRYLLISSSRPGTQVANLQGIWNKDIEPPWDGAQHLNINLANELLAGPSLQSSIFSYRLLQINYEANGWVVHQVSDIWAKNHQIEAYPLLEGCTKFLLDWLLEGSGGYLETNPSTSPEHMFIAPDGKPASVSYSTTMDMSIIKEVFSAIVSAAEVLGRHEDELVQKVREAQPRLLPTKIARDGSIMEWAQDFEDPEIHHRHVSHLFGLFPGHTITVEKTPDLCKAADYTLFKRGEEGPGWSTMWKAALWARLHNSEHAYRMVKHLFDLVDPENESKYEGGLYSNLFTAHPPFQIDANFGFSAAIAEMLVQSTVKDLYLLPALPRDKWANGCVKGLKARGGVTVNICWKEGDLHEVGLWSKEHNSLKRLHYRGTVVNAHISSGRAYTFNRQMEDEDWVLVEPSTGNTIKEPTWMDSDSPRPLKVTFSGPAKYWTDAIPIGNGRLGAMIWGGVSSEIIQLNEDTLWTGTPSDFTNPGAPEALSDVRKFVDDGQYAEATAAAAKLLGNPADVYQLLGDIKLEFDESHLTYAEETYHRELDLDTATAKVKYSVGDIEFTREHFASNPDQVIVLKISASKSGSVSFLVSLDSMLDHHCYINAESQIIMEGSCPGKRIPPKLKASDNPKGIQFSAVLDLQISDGIGVIRVLDNKTLKVEGSDWAVLLLVASSSFESPFTKPSDSGKDPTSESLCALKSITNLSYSDLYARHLDDYQNLFRRVSFQLWKSPNVIVGNDLVMNNLMPSANTSYVKGSKDDLIPTVERIKSFQSDEDPSLVELLFQFGRYLLISCSRPRTQVANLQGVWNKDLQPKWDSAPHLNINLEMNYWLSLPCNLSECQEPLFDFIKSLSINGSKTAQVNARYSNKELRYLNTTFSTK